ncbi:hypothetical protein AB5J52_03710 [Streptomyces sp. R39]|uniref:MerR family transcriptional regulator n=1 Tax=Streptomyces sp. R39 TaxID=3238631 RepID=A0AB39QF30_9ACTN
MALCQQDVEVGLAVLANLPHLGPHPMALEQLVDDGELSARADRAPPTGPIWLGDVRVVRELRALRELGIPAERTRLFLECLASGAAAVDDCPSSMAE